VKTVFSAIDDCALVTRSCQLWGFEHVTLWSKTIPGIAGFSLLKQDAAQTPIQQSLSLVLRLDLMPFAHPFQHC
jgi:hypothetical protein